MVRSEARQVKLPAAASHGGGFRTVAGRCINVNEALYLADRLILMTDGPAASVGEILPVPFPRPRERVAVLEHPQYYAFHGHVIDFLEHHAQQSVALTG